MEIMDQNYKWKVLNVNKIVEMIKLENLRKIRFVVRN